MQRLIESLDQGGIHSDRLRSRSGEVGGDRRAKAVALGSHLWNVRSHVHAGSPNVVAWPLTGWWEVPLWRHRTHKTYIAMHDPEPLVAQNGLTAKSASRSAKLAGNKWPHLVTLSPEAYEVTTRFFDPDRVHLLPHPMRSPELGFATPPGKSVLVLGQYKPARDLDVMASIASSLSAAGWSPIVAGRGWPKVPGWNVFNRFVSESEFHELLAAASAVLLPYKYYFQSGVALRALEAGVPVVGRSTGFLTTILGANFPGAVRDWNDPTSWLDAVEAAAASRTYQMSSAADYSIRGARQWRDLMFGLDEGTVAIK